MGKYSIQFFGSVENLNVPQSVGPYTTGNHGGGMVDVEGGNNLLYLPFDKIIEENRKSSKRSDEDE